MRGCQAVKEFLAGELSSKKILEIQLTVESRTPENIGIDTNLHAAIAKRIILTTGKGTSRGISRTSRIVILVNRYQSTKPARTWKQRV